MVAPMDPVVDHPGSSRVLNSGCCRSPPTPNAQLAQSLEGEGETEYTLSKSKFPPKLGPVATQALPFPPTTNHSGHVDNPADVTLCRMVSFRPFFALLISTCRAGCRIRVGFSPRLWDCLILGSVPGGNLHLVHFNVHQCPPMSTSIPRRKAPKP